MQFCPRDFFQLGRLYLPVYFFLRRQLRTKLPRALARRGIKKKPPHFRGVTGEQHADGLPATHVEFAG